MKKDEKFLEFLGLQSKTSLWSNDDTNSSSSQKRVVPLEIVDNRQKKKQKTSHVGQRETVLDSRNENGNEFSDDNEDSDTSQIKFDEDDDLDDDAIMNAVEEEEEEGLESGNYNKKEDSGYKKVVKEAEKDLGGTQVIDEAEGIGETGRLFVRNLSFMVTEEQLTQHFSSFGEIAEVWLSRCSQPTTLYTLYLFLIQTSAHPTIHTLFSHSTYDWICLCAVCFL